MTLEFDCQYRYADGFELAARFTAEARCTALTGPSGSGKTTVLKLIAGLLHPLKGRIALADRVLVDTGNSISVPIHRRGIGLVMQAPNLFPHLNVRQNLEFGRRRRSEKFADAELARLIDVLRLKELLERKPATLSGGEQSRVALGRALASGPALLLMDEPLQSLDAGIKSEILDYLGTVIELWNVPVLLVTHHIEEARRIATSTLTVERGRIREPEEEAGATSSRRDS